MITIDIEIEKRNRVNDLSNRLQNRIENLFFSIIMKLPDRFIPHFLMERIDRYLDKRIHQLKRQTIKQTWQTIHLQDYVDSIRKESIKKAPSEE